MKHLLLSLSILILCQVGAYAGVAGAEGFTKLGKAEQKEVAVAIIFANHGSYEFNLCDLAVASNPDFDLYVNENGVNPLIKLIPKTGDGIGLEISTNLEMNEILNVEKTSVNYVNKGTILKPNIVRVRSVVTNGCTNNY